MAHPFMIRASILLLAGFAIFLSFCNSGESSVPEQKNTKSAFNHVLDKNAKNASEKKALRFADSMRPWLRKNGYSTRLIFVADMDLHIFIKRFYALDIDSAKILNSFLVAHGKGQGSTWDSVVFSNVPGSLCTSRGRYKLGKSYFGEFGKGYKLHGLDASNSNALKRLIVFHSYSTQTEEEYGKPNYLSSGCPMLAVNSFAYCDSLIQRENKSVLMVVY
jgi:hypothetical protein